MATARSLFEACLIELSKVNAPSLLLLDYNYFINKAVNQYINKRYSIYDTSLQTTDDLRVLKATAILTPSKSDAYDLFEFGTNAKLTGGIYEVDLPDDYMHLLNCVCVYQIEGGNYKCYNSGDYVLFGATKLTSDLYGIIVNDYYHRPLPERPYYFIHNVNTRVEVPTNPINYETSKGTDFPKSQWTLKVEIDNETVEIPIVYQCEYYTHKYPVIKYNNRYWRLRTKDNHILSIEDGELMANHDLFDFDNIVVIHDDNDESLTKRITPIPLKRSISLKFGNSDFVERTECYRYGNVSKVRMEIRYGSDDSVFKLKKVLVDYIKSPQFIRLTQEQVNKTRDESLILEFPDYVCQEIINELVTLVMENVADPRLANHQTVSTSIASPTQQLAPQQTLRRLQTSQ